MFVCGCVHVPVCMCVYIYPHVCVCVCMHARPIGEYSISKLILKLVAQYILLLLLSIKILNILVPC